MSNLDVHPAPTECGGREEVRAQPVRELLTGKIVQLGESTKVRRLLPSLGRRMVGAWCFVDHYGPDDIADEPGMQVPPHPHTGLQTVSRLHEGDVLHRDSLGSVATVRALGFRAFRVSPPHGRAGRRGARAVRPHHRPVI